MLYKRYLWVQLQNLHKLCCACSPYIIKKDWKGSCIFTWVSSHTSQQVLWHFALITYAGCGGDRGNNEGRMKAISTCVVRGKKSVISAGKVWIIFKVNYYLRASIALKRCLNQGNSYKVQHLVEASIQFLRVSPFSSWQKAWQHPGRLVTGGAESSFREPGADYGGVFQSLSPQWHMSFNKPHITPKRLHLLIVPRPRPIIFKPPQPYSCP